MLGEAVRRDWVAGVGGGYTNFDEMKADEYRYWQSLPGDERLDAVEEMIRTAYALKGWEMEPDVPRLQRPIVRLPCPWR